MILSASRRYYRATRALCVSAIDEYAAGTDRETPEFLCVNREAALAERGVPAWLRSIIDFWLLRRLDYFARTGGTG